MSNIVFIIISGEEISGGEKRLGRTINYLIKNDFDNNYILFTTRATYDSLNKTGIRIPEKNSYLYRIPFQRGSNNKGHKAFEINNGKKNKSFLFKIYIWVKHLLRLILLCMSLTWFLKKRKIDIVLPLQMNYGVTAAVFSKIFRSKTKLLLNYNDPYFFHINKGIVKQSSLYYWGLKKADLIDFPGIYYYKNLLNKKFNLKNTSIRFSPCSFVDDSLQANKEKENIVVFAHRFIEHTNPMLFLEVVKHLVKEKRAKAFFYMLGFGELRAKICNFIENEGLGSHIKVMYSKNIGEILSGSKVFLSLRENENYHSQSLLEAMACENAIIATNVGETSKIVNSSNGYIVQKNVEEIAEKVYYLLNNEGQRKLLGKNARKQVKENHTIEKVSNYTKLLFETILKDKK